MNVIRSRSRTSGGTGSSNGRTRLTMFWPAGVLRRASNLAFARSPRPSGFWPSTPPVRTCRVLPIPHAGGGSRASHELCAVAAARSHIQHLHPRLRRCEDEELQRVPALVGLAVRIGAVGRSNERGIIRSAALCTVLRNCHTGHHEDGDR